MPCESFHQNSISSLVMIVRLNMIHLYLAPKTKVIVGYVCSTVWHISHLRNTLVLIQCTSQTQEVVEYGQISIQVIGVGYSGSTSCRHENCASHLFI